MPDDSVRGRGPTYTFLFTKEDFALLRHYAANTRSRDAVVTHLLWWLHQYWYDMLNLHRQMQIKPKPVHLDDDRPRPEGTMQWQAPADWEITEVLWVVARVRAVGQGNLIAWIAEMLRVNGDAFQLYRKTQQDRWKALEASTPPGTAGTVRPRYQVTERLYTVFTPEGDDQEQEEDDGRIIRIENREEPTIQQQPPAHDLGADGEPESDPGTGKPLHSRRKSVDKVRRRPKL